MGDNVAKPVEAAAQAEGDPARAAWELLLEYGLRLRTHVATAAAALDLTPMQTFALKRMEPGRPIPMNALADQLICDASNVTGIVDKLESRGLIQRRPDERDRRVKMLVLTDKGVDVRREFLARLLDPPAPFRALSAEEQMRLRDSLRSLLAQWPMAEG
jgi:DNA-binding MarR family transcriptional regulator